MSNNRLATSFHKRSMPINTTNHPIPDILGHEQIDLSRLKKQAQLSQTQIPKFPRITRTLKTLESVLKVLEEHGRSSKTNIDHLIQSVEQENHQLTKQLHECQVAYLKLQAHTASLQSLKECYCRYAHMLDGARTMFHAYQQTNTRRDSIDQVKLGLKECTQTLCAIEAQLESMLGTFILNLQEISGFSRICPGDEYDLVIRYGQQKWKTRGRILKHNKSEQVWTRQNFHLKAKLADLLFIKISEVKLLGVSLKTIGTKCFEVNNFYSIEPQRMIVNANQSGTIKLVFLVHWDLYDQVDTKFTFYNPNRTYSDVTRTWSMFVGNATLLRTVNDALVSSTLSSSSSSTATPGQYTSKRISTYCTLNSPESESSSLKENFNEEVQYDEIPNPIDDLQINKEQIIEIPLVQDDTRSSSYSSSFAAGFNSDELSSAASVECGQHENEEVHLEKAKEEDEDEDEDEENPSIYKLDLLIDRIRTSIDELRLIDRSFSVVFEQIEDQINELDRRIKLEIHEQTEQNLEIENVLNDFNFLNSIDDEEETSKTSDSGFEGEQIHQDNRSNVRSTINSIFVDVLNRILVLLNYILTRSKPDDELVLEHLQQQNEQLRIVFNWNQQNFLDFKQICSSSDRTLIENFSLFNDKTTISFEQSLDHIGKQFQISRELAEFLLNNLCLLPFRSTFSRPKSVNFVQIYFLVTKQRSDIENLLTVGKEQLESFENLSDLVAKQDWLGLSRSINRRSLNNEEILRRLLIEFDFQVPDELIGLFETSIRRDLIRILRSFLSCQQENPSKRLQIHKTIFNVQQIDSI